MTVDLAPSSTYPSLERAPGKRDNWVEATGGLPKYIERIAKRLHYEQGMSISRAIATAVNTVKRWARGGTVTKRGTRQRITAKTQAQAAAALAQWETKKARAKALSVEDEGNYLDLAEYNLDVIRSAWNAKERIRRERYRRQRMQAAEMGVAEDTPVPEYEYRHVAEVWNTHIIVRGDNEKIVKIPYEVDDKGKVKFGREIPVRQDYVELSLSPSAFDEVIDLAPKWRHGYIPANNEAKRIKAKQSAEAMKRMNRLYGSPEERRRRSKAALRRSNEQRRKEQRQKSGQQKSSDIDNKALKSSKGGATERTSTGRVATARRAVTPDSRTGQRYAPKNQKEASKGGGRDIRARKAWNEIPESQKVTRNGKRYVVSVYRGKQQLTEWIGNNPAQEAPDSATRILRSITAADARKMSTAELRRALRVNGQPDSVRKVLNRVLREKVASEKGRS